jgi:hypothetical protein
MDAPRSVAAFAAALPLDGLDAWKVYLGLPTFGARSPPGGVDEVMKLLAADAPGLVHGPVHSQAAEEIRPRGRTCAERWASARTCRLVLSAARWVLRSHPRCWRGVRPARRRRCW